MLIRVAVCVIMRTFKIGGSDEHKTGFENTFMGVFHFPGHIFALDHSSW